MLFTKTREKKAAPEVDWDLDLTELEDEIAVIINKDAQETPSLDPLDSAVPGLAEVADPQPSAEPAAEPLLKRQSSLTQKSLAGLGAFEDEMRGTGTSLESIREAVSAIDAAQHTATRFIGGMRAIILRADHLEEAHAALLSENRRQSQQIEQARAQQAQQDSLNETNKHRIEQLAREYYETKLTLGAAQLEANEAREALAEVESERALLLHELAAKTAASERLTRENETLRQKQVRQQVDLAEIEQRRLETDRRLEEAASLHKQEAAEVSELRLKLEASDKECRRMQKQAELVQMRLGETQERLAALEADLEELTARHSSTTNRLRSETEALKARLDAAARKGIADEDEIGRLKQQLSEALAATKVLQVQLSNANGRLEAERSIHNSDEGFHEQGGIGADAATVQTTLPKQAQQERRTSGIASRRRSHAVTNGKAVQKGM